MLKTAVIYGIDDDLGRYCEWQVQVMLEAGIQFLSGHPGYDLDGDPAELNQALREARSRAGDQHGISGGQYNTVINHLRVIRDSGYAWWLQELSKDREPSEVFDFDGSLTSIPQTCEKRSVDE